MAFVRFTRDKRGYEQFSLVEPTTNRRGKPRQRVLYWYRTPPNIRVGREPFDESVRRALEAQNPSIQFDWRKIVETPIPSVETERWRERRRLEKAEKASRRSAGEDQSGDENQPSDFASELGPSDDSVEADAAREPNAQQQQVAEAGRVEVMRKRRRRRGRRGRQLPASEASSHTPSRAEDEQASPPFASAETDEANADPDEE